MPRYFFHRTNGTFERDSVGTEFSGQSEARLHAVVFAGETLKDDPLRLLGSREMYIEVTDDADDLLFTVRVECFAAAKKIVGA